MKIAYLSTSTLPSLKANSVHVMKMCQSFANNGHDVDLYHSKSEILVNNIDFFSFYGVDPVFHLKSNCVRKKNRYYSFYHGFRISKNLRRSIYDFAYARCPHSAFFAGALNKTPFIYEAHDFPKRKMRFMLERSMFKLPTFERLVVISKSLRSDYLSSFSFLQDNSVVVAHDGADVHENFIEEADFLRPEGVGQFRVGYVGSLSSGRGLEMIISFARLRPNIEFHVVGGDSEEVLKLKSESPSNIIFHGFIEPSKVFKYLRSFDVLLMPYESNIGTVKYMSPMKMFEYMASGRAIISSDIPVLREVLSPEFNALLVSLGDYNSWLSSIDRLFESKNLRIKLAKNAFDDLASKYTWAKRAQSVLAGIN